RLQGPRVVLIGGAENLSEGGVIEVVIGESELRAVQEIVNFEAQGDRGATGDRKRLVEADVYGSNAVAVEGITADEARNGVGRSCASEGALPEVVHRPRRIIDGAVVDLVVYDHGAVLRE